MKELETNAELEECRRLITEMLEMLPDEMTLKIYYSVLVAYNKI